MNVPNPSVLSASLTNASSSVFNLPTAIDATASTLNHLLLQSSWQGASSAIAFIDASVSDYQTLVAGIAPGTEVHLLDSSQDAVTQITNTLLGRHNISSLHIVSHGEAGGLDFGTGKLNLSDLPEYAAQLQSWSKALTDDADILLYGCDVAQGELGQAFTSILSQLTGADVAASADLTGSAALGGNWTLEYQTGSIEAGLAFSPSVRESYTYILPSFTAASPVAVGTNPLFVASGDFNGDGKADLAVANFNSSSVSVLLGTGSGSFGAATNFTVGANPNSVAIGDFNGDGKADLAVANESANTVSILLGTGSGSFGAATNITVGTNPASVAIGDFNGDGKADLAVANESSNNVSVLLGTGSGSFGAATNVTVGTNPRSVAIGDFNGDGKADLATANRGSNNVSVLLGTGSGSFGAATNVTVDTNPRSVAIGDFNGDGKADLVTPNFDSNNVSVLLGTGSGSFGAATNVTVGTGPYSVAIGDFNGDGKADLAAANITSNNVSVLLGTGSGSFGAATNVTVGAAPFSVAIGDFNGDGKADIVAANQSSNNVSVLLNTSPKITVAAGIAPAEIGTTGTFTLTLDQPAPIGGLTVNFTPSGTATNPADYSFSTGSNLTSVSANSFVIAAGATTATLNVVPVNDGIVDPNETVILTLAAGNDYFLGSNATARFSAATNVAVETNPASVAIGDFNGDGKADLVTGNNGTTTVSVLLGTGTGGFGTATPFTVGLGPTGVAIGDFNRDGKADLAVANYGSSSISVLLGTGTGSFGAATNFTAGTRPRAIAIGDFNGDGKADLAAANYSSGDISILLGTGTGSFGAATNFTVGSNPQSIAIGDFDGDGKADLAVANDTNVLILLGTGTGSFGAATSFTAGLRPQSVAIGDFNGDGKADLAAANYTSGNISVLLGTGTGSFGAATNFTVGANPTSVAIGDFDGDGKADLAAANSSSNTISVLLGTGTGSFGTATNFAVGSRPLFVAIRDFNGDGKGDIATANQLSDNVSVLLNTAPSATLVIAENTAPVLNAAPNPALTAINEDAGAPIGVVGTLVSALVDLNPPSGGFDNVTDGDAGAVTGIAITAADTTNGTWFYSTNNGTNWTALGTVSNTTARLLAADANTRVYFQPNANYNGTVTNGITFRAWDTTSGTNGALANTSTNGGTTAFSTVTDTASLTVNAVNDAPILSVLSNSLNLDGINDYVSTTAPITHNQNFTYEAWVKFPTNNPAWSGIITTSTLAGSGGFVQFSNNGSGRLRAEISGSSTFNVDGTISMSDGNWHHVALTYDGASLKTYVDGALDINSSVNQTFTVNRQVFIGAERQLSAGWTSAGQITEVRIWNATRTQAEIQANRNQAIAPNSTGLIGYWQLNQNSGTTANDLSSSGLNATLLNGATWATNSPFPGSISLAAINEDAGTPTGAVGTLVSALVDLNPPVGGLDNVTDGDAGAVTGIAITAADTTNGTWFYSTTNGTNWTALGAVANTTARLLAADANTRVYFQPNANYNGTVTNALTFRAWDTTSGTNGNTADTSTNGGITAFSIVTNTAAITVNAVNDAPVATSDALSAVAEDSGSRTISFASLLANDSTGPANESTQTLTITALSNVVGGTAVISGTNINFTPTLNYNGAASFDYTVQDNGTTNGAADPKTATGTAAFTLTEVNDAPVATNDALSAIAEDSGVRTISFASLLANDSTGPANESTQTLTITAVNNVVGGTAIINGTNIDFTPTANYNGAASFDYTVQDDGTTNGVADPKTALGTTSFTITEVNNAPVATNDSLSAIAEDSGSRTISFASLLANDSTGPANENTQTLTITAVNNVVGGTVVINGTNIEFTPTLNYNGATSFDYTVQDNGTTNSANDFKTATATAAFTITEVNDAPVATNDALSAIAEDSGVRTISFASLLGNDNTGPANENTQTLTITAVNNVVGGTVVINGTNIEFTPTLNYNGAASFDYTVQDNGTTNSANDFKTATATAAFTITEVNDAPVATNDALSAIAEDSGVRTISFASLLGNDNTGPANESAQTLTLTSISNVIGGTAVINGTNIEFTLTLNYNGAASFDYTVQDNGTTNGAADFKTATATVSFTITAVNDAPTLIGNATLAATAQNTTNPNGSTLSSLFNSLFSDVDTGASLSGLAIVGNTANSSTQGQWQYALDGTTWNNVGTVAEGATALALAASTRLRFLPVPGYNGTPSGLTVRALDNTYSGGFSTDSNRVTIDTTNTGGSSAIAGGSPTALTTSVVPLLPQLVWRNSGTGQNAVWQLNTFTLQSSYFLPSVTEPGWQIVASADLNHDGTADLVWRNQRTGANALWELDNTGYRTGYFLPTVTDRNWQIASAADVSGDGTADLVWRNVSSGANAIWQLNGFSVQTTAFITAVTDRNWQLVSTADFNQDGTADLLWRNASTGANAIWQMNNATLQSGTFFTAVADPNWQIIGTGNFDGDATPDIVWRNKASGENAIWQMQGATLQSGFLLPTVADANWQIAGVADLGGDSTPELLWHHKPAGQTVIWQLNGFSYTTTTALPHLTDPNWSVKPFVAPLHPPVNPN